MRITYTVAKFSLEGGDLRSDQEKVFDDGPCRKRKTGKKGKKGKRGKRMSSNSVLDILSCCFV